MLKVGDVVMYVNPTANEFPALVTAIWGDPESNPSINLVYVTDDIAATDQYGRQIAHKTSIVHEDSQSAHGNYWK